MSIAFKLSTLAIRTLAKPISVALKSQAKQHATFRKFCINIAQTTHRFDINMRMNLLGEKGLQHVRPLNESKAIDSGANFISESFLFSVAGGLIVFESWRSRRKEMTRREGVSDAIEALQDEVEELKSSIEHMKAHNKSVIQDGQRPRLSEAIEVPHRSPSKPLKNEEEDKLHIRRPTDPLALKILSRDHGALIRKAASEVRSGTRVADL